MTELAVYDCMLFFMRAARPDRVRETFNLIDDGSITCCLSPEIIAEIRDVLTRPRHVQQFPQLTPDRVFAFLEDIARRARFYDNIPQAYVLDRDPKDSKYVNLAIFAGAKFLVTRDKDLLDLMDHSKNPGQDFGRRFPHLSILEPAAFVRKIRGLNP